MPTRRNLLAAATAVLTVLAVAAALGAYVQFGHTPHPDWYAGALFAPAGI